jgi:hypothetical protein
VDKSLFASPGNPNLTYLPLLFIPMLLIIEWINRNRQHQFDIVELPAWLRWPAYYVLLGMIVQFGQGDVSFIYFQF